MLKFFLIANLKHSQKSRKDPNPGLDPPFGYSWNIISHIDVM